MGLGFLFLKGMIMGKLKRLKMAKERLLDELQENEQIVNQQLELIRMQVQGVNLDPLVYAAMRLGERHWRLEEVEDAIMELEAPAWERHILRGIRRNHM